MAKLLVVNDDPVQLHLLASLLERDHSEVVRFHSSEAAWQWLQDGHVPDGIILDLHMPEINGWRFCELLHTRSLHGLSQPPVLIVSATYSGIDPAELLADIGASDFLALPAEPTKIRQHVNRLVEQPAQAKGFCVWIVSSDDREIQRLRGVVSEQGWEVATWSGGDVMRSTSTSVSPDFVLIDDALEDGLPKDILNWCKSVYPHAIGIVMGSEQEGAEDWSLASNVGGYLPKGCDSLSIITLCEKWRWERALSRTEHLLEMRTSDLKESEAQFRGLFEMLPDVLVIYDGQGIIQHINSTGAYQLGYLSNDLVGTRVQDLEFSIGDPSRELPTITVAGGESQWKETYLRRKDESALPVEVLERAVRFQGQQQMLMVARDMTARQHMERENATLEQQLRQVQKMEAVGRLASGVAHDMNNILTAILAHASLLKARSDETDASWNAGDVIEKAAHRGKQLTSQLLGFARQGKHHHVPVDLHKVIQEVIGLLGRTVDKTIALHTDLLAEESWVLGDPNQLYQVLMNLAVNASDAMSHKGELFFQTDNEAVSPGQASQVPGLTAGDYVVVRVIDTGEGIPQEVQAHIFEPFFTTKEQGRGSGMGLAMVYGIVKNHHGYIGVTSTMGVGTTMRVYLPSVPCEEPQARPAQVSEHTTGTGHVLIIDDEKEVAEAGQAILEYLGYHTTVRYSGQDALALFQDPSQQIDLVLLDMVMPDMSGSECFAELRRLRPDSKVLLCTGYDRNHAVQELLNQGVMGFLQKPYDLDELSHVCAEAMEKPLTAEVCASGSPV